MHFVNPNYWNIRRVNVGCMLIPEAFWILEHFAAYSFWYEVYEYPLKHFFKNLACLDAHIQHKYTVCVYAQHLQTATWFQLEHDTMLQ